MHDAIPYYVLTASSGDSLCTASLSAMLLQEHRWKLKGYVTLTTFTWRFVPSLEV